MRKIATHVRSWATRGALVLTLAGCASSGPAVERLTPDELVERGISQYQAGRHNDAIRALERLTRQFPGHPRMEEARYYLAEAHLARREYLLAAGEFVRLANDHPFGSYAASARYGVCQAYFHLSPDPPLDQEYTLAAIDHCLALLTYYPDSEYVERTREKLVELENKLAEKDFRAGEHYFRRGLYHSALIYYDDVVGDFPTSRVAPRALLRMVEAYSRLGYEEEAREARERLLREYPGSAEARQARDMSLAGSP